jgi:hypothetical protein
MDCLLCRAQKFVFAFKVAGEHLLQCSGCGILARSAPPPPAAAPERADVGRDALERLLLEEMSLRGVRGATAVAGSGEIPPGGPFMGLALLDDPLCSSDPLAILAGLRARLAQGGVLLMASSPLDFGPLRLPLASWPSWQRPMRFFMRREHQHLLLLKAGFGSVWMARQRLGSAVDRSARPARLLSRAASAAVRMALQTGMLHYERRRLTTVLVSAQAQAPARKPKLSIVMPVYNERATFQACIDAVLAKRLDGLDKEVIVVESRSTDGTADLVRAYEGRPGVRLIFQERARGKGNAVREGLKAASGSLVLIQDADLEYDVDDYDALLEPLLAHQSMFVLGSRHMGEWKMREFSGQPLVSLFFNLGHLFFTAVLNALLRERMTDPFTMYKVFHRDALYGLEFTCNRFDFDHELVIKLVRKGYRPREIGVNYASRSYSEGKKVSVWRDALTWLWTDLRLRLGPLGRRPH